MKRALALAGTLAVLVVLNIVLPRVTNPYYFQVLMLIGINIVLAVSLNLVNGFTGQFSIGHAGFMAVGAYASAMFTLKLGQPLAASWHFLPAPVAEGLVLLMALVAGGLLAAVAGWIVGLPSLRLRGDYLAIVTLGFGEIIRVLILNIDAIGAARGLPGIPQYSTFFWVFGCAVLVIVVARRVATSTHGRALFAIRDDEVAAEALGVDTTRYKVIAFVLGAFFAGVAGGLFAHFLSYLNPSSFTFLKSIEVIAMVVLGGMGSISGSVLAAIILTLLPEVLRSVKELRMVIYSLMLIVLMITRPQGLLGTHELDISGWFNKLFGRRPAPKGAA
jgi:branched-chain amino acid transport system permease protein